jgi:hypothetical protein
MILDSDGRLWVATYERSFGALMFNAYSADGTLERSEVVDSGPESGLYPSLARTEDQRFHLAYYDRANGKPKFASRDENGWKIEDSKFPLSVDAGQWISLTLDGTGGRHVAYLDGTHKRFVMKSLDSAICQPNLENPQNKLPGSTSYGFYASIGISGTTQETAQLVASFYDKSGGNLVLATCMAETLVFQVADGEDTKSGLDTGDVGLWSSLAIEPKERKPAVAYFDRTHGVLKYVQSQTGALEIVVVDNGIRSSSPTRHLVGQHAALEFNAMTGQPRIAYLDATARAIRIAHRSQHGAWKSSVLVSMDAGLMGGIGMGVDLVLDAKDKAWVAWGQWQLIEGQLKTQIELMSCQVGQVCGAQP